MKIASRWWWLLYGTKLWSSVIDEDAYYMEQGCDYLLLVILVQPCQWGQWHGGTRQWLLMTIRVQSIDYWLLMMIMVQGSHYWLLIFWGLGAPSLRNKNMLVLYKVTVIDYWWWSWLCRIEWYFIFIFFTRNSSVFDSEKNARKSRCTIQCQREVH